MKGVARIGVSILGLYLIAGALSRIAGTDWALALAGIGYLVMAVGAAVILLCGGVICLIFRDRISSWIVAGQQAELPSDINLERIECIIFSLIGIIVFSRAIGTFAFAVSRFVTPSIAEMPDGLDSFLGTWACVAAVVACAELCLALILVFFPHKVQALLRRRRGF